MAEQGFISYAADGVEITANYANIEECDDLAEFDALDPDILEEEGGATYLQGKLSGEYETVEEAEELLEQSAICSDQLTVYDDDTFKLVQYGEEQAVQFTQ